MSKKKLEKVAKNYITAHSTYMLYDCCDAMHDIEKHEAQWSVLTDDKINIKDYIRDNLSEFFQKEVRQIIDDLSGEDYNEIVSKSCGELLFPLVPDATKYTPY